MIMEKLKENLSSLTSVVCWGILSAVVIYGLWFGLSLLSAEQTIFGASVVLTLIGSFVIWVGIRFHPFFSFYTLMVIGVFWLVGAVFGVDYLGSIGLPENFSQTSAHYVLYPFLGGLYCMIATLFLLWVVFLAVSLPQDRGHYIACSSGFIAVAVAGVYIINCFLPVV